MGLPPVGVGDRKDGRHTVGKQSGRAGTSQGPRETTEGGAGRNRRGLPPGGNQKESRRRWQDTKRGGRRTKRAGKSPNGRREQSERERERAPNGRPGVKRAGAGKRVPGAGKSQNGCPGRERAKTGAGADHRPARPGRPIRATSCSGRTRWSAPSRRSSERSQRDSPTGYPTPRWWHASPVRASS